MTSAAVGPAGSGTTRSGTLRLLVAIGLPLAIVVVAYVLWRISDQLLYIGPLDRAAFGWAVVIPVWCSAPVVAAFAWRSLSRGERRAAAAVVAFVVAAVSGVLLWQAVAFPECANPVRSPIGWTIPAAFVGLTIGAGLAISGLLGTAIVRAGHPLRAVFITLGAEFGMVFLAILGFGVVALGAGYGSTGGTCGLPN
jgi:hypothetical protein